jgi:ubiquinone/menaquinone biosynthesis C-methylase UbiE
MRSLVSYTAQSQGPELFAFNEGEERLQCARLYNCPWPSYRVYKAPVAAQFENPFGIEDLEVFDDIKLQSILNGANLGLTLEKLAWSLHDAPETLIQRVERNLGVVERASFMKELHRRVPKSQVEAARCYVLDRLFWELTYWKTPELYEELIEGEQLHPGIFQQLEPDICRKVVLDAGAGSGRVSFECVYHGASMVYAVEPCPGLLGLLEQKIANRSISRRIVPLHGSFDMLPLADDSVDEAISCSAFTAEPAQGGEAGLAELKRVTRPGGKVVIIWPRTQDYDWLADHGFQYVALPEHEEMRVRFRSMQSALRCARHFYAHNPNVVQYLLRERKPEVPFLVLGINPPCDYCWLIVK